MKSKQKLYTLFDIIYGLYKSGIDETAKMDMIYGITLEKGFSMDYINRVLDNIDEMHD